MGQHLSLRTSKSHYAVPTALERKEVIEIVYDEDDFGSIHVEAVGGTGEDKSIQTADLWDTIFMSSDSYQQKLKTKRKTMKKIQFRNKRSSYTQSEPCIGSVIPLTSPTLNEADREQTLPITVAEREQKYFRVSQSEHCFQSTTGQEARFLGLTANNAQKYLQGGKLKKFRILKNYAGDSNVVEKHHSNKLSLNSEYKTSSLLQKPPGIKKFPNSYQVYSSDLTVYPPRINKSSRLWHYQASCETSDYRQNPVQDNTFEDVNSLPKMSNPLAQKSLENLDMDASTEQIRTSEVYSLSSRTCEKVTAVQMDRSRDDVTSIQSLDDRKNIPGISTTEAINTEQPVVKRSTANAEPGQLADEGIVYEAVEHTAETVTNSYHQLIPKYWNTDPGPIGNLGLEPGPNFNTPSCVLSVTARSPVCKRGKIATLALITLKSEVCQQKHTQLSPMLLEASIQPESVEAKLIPDCLEFLRSTQHMSGKRRHEFKLERVYIGGNTTLNKMPHGQSDPKSEASSGDQVKSAPFVSPLQPVYMYSYHFWVFAEPWVEKVFQNPYDRRIESIGRLSDCRIRLTKRHRRNPQGFHQRMVNVIAPNAMALRKCCRLFDDKFPSFYATAGLYLDINNLSDLSRFSMDRKKARRSRKYKRSGSSLSAPQRKRKISGPILDPFDLSMESYSQPGRFLNTFSSFC
ncbi:unnamed protein product [Calicophoron daubneyi]|uniref:Uncharacterized protein n=1 Tax=Calicophoron daubneyi TaxID=300641 RepID=A0AAV2T8S9_CALDB